MEQLINEYLESRRLAWSPTTIRSERYRLMGMLPQLTGDPTILWKSLEKRLKPYSRVSAWTRVTDFWQWLIERGLRESFNPYEKFRKDNARLFKHTYQPRFPGVTFEQAVSKIAQLDERSRELAIQILGTGARFSESVQSGSDIVGKGSKRRHLFRPSSTSDHGVSYGTFRRALKEIGLRPHDLRKLCAIRLVEEGLKEQDLLKVMGWSSMETAKFYLAPKNDEELKAIFNKIHKELK